MEILFFLCGLLAIVPMCVLATNDRRPHTLHVHHWHHRSRQARPPSPERSTERSRRSLAEGRYQVITGSSSAYVLDTHTGAKFAIVQPTYKAVSHEPMYSKLLTRGKS